MSEQHFSDVHKAIRELHGPGRVEFLFDRQRAMAQDMVDGIGMLVINESPCWEGVHEGAVTVRRKDDKRFRIIRDKKLDGVRTATGEPVRGYYVDALPWPPDLTKVDIKPDDGVSQIEARMRYYSPRWT